MYGSFHTRWGSFQFVCEALFILSMALSPASQTGLVESWLDCRTANWLCSDAGGKGTQHQLGYTKVRERKSGTCWMVTRLSQGQWILLSAATWYRVLWGIRQRVDSLIAPTDRGDQLSGLFHHRVSHNMWCSNRVQKKSSRESWPARIVANQLATMFQMRMRARAKPRRSISGPTGGLW